MTFVSHIDPDALFGELRDGLEPGSQAGVVHEHVDLVDPLGEPLRRNRRP